MDHLALNQCVPNEGIIQGFMTRLRFINHEYAFDCILAESGHTQDVTLIFPSSDTVNILIHIIFIGQTIFKYFQNSPISIGYKKYFCKSC